MISRSFVDLLFILLCAALVMLANSSQLRVAEATPAKVAGGGRLDLAGRELRVLVVGPVQVGLDDERWDGDAPPVGVLAADDRVVVVPADEEVSHHRVLRVWFELREQGLEVDLGVLPSPSMAGSSKERR
ncbi:MAG: hypothetical protein FJ104_01455 [Deltaproteobacteria bacterium]|nr:hypothetical protein [Deltaproteobacteria bacterium]